MVRIAGAVEAGLHPEDPRLWDRKGKYNIVPEEKEKNFDSIMTENPPSLDFHKKLWGWFSDKVREFHSSGESSGPGYGTPFPQSL